MPQIRLKLHPKQSIAFATPATEVLFGGAAGGGKSHLLRVIAIALAFDVPGVQVYLFRRKFPDLYKNHMEGPTSFRELLSPWLKQRRVRINDSKHVIRFDNGSTIHLCHCQHEKDVYSYQGAEIHVLLIDEITHLTETMYRYLRSRVRVVSIDVPKRWARKIPMIIASGNPGGVGHTWVKASWIDLAPPFALRWMKASEGGLRRQFIPAVLDDNPTLIEADPTYESRLESLGNPSLVRAMRYGDWDIVAGGMFDDVWDPARHIVKPFIIPMSWYIDRSFDWGSSKPFSVGWWAESDGSEVELHDGTIRSWPRGTLFRFAELYGWNGKANEGIRWSAAHIARKIIEVEEQLRLRGRVRPGPADSSIYDVENGQCIADDMARMQVLWTRANKGPGSRKNGFQLMRDRLRASLASPIEEAGLFVFENCRHFIRTVPVLPRDEREPDDVDTKSEDHVADETRYRILARRAAIASKEM